MASGGDCQNNLEKITLILHKDFDTNLLKVCVYVV